MSHPRTVSRNETSGTRFLCRGLLLRRTLPMSTMVVGAAMFVIAIGAHFISGSVRDLPSKGGVQVYRTAAGEQATVALADGSHARLGPATKLLVTTRPSDASIDVQVHGQALFTVTHKEHRSFRVHTTSAVVRVLGTNFFVRQYDTDRVARVVVTEGRVSISAARHLPSYTMNQILLASMMGTVDDSGHVQITPHIAADDYTSWTNGQVVFNKTPARDAVVELGRAYGVDIRITDSTLANQQLTWTIPIARRSLDVVLVSLVDVLGAHTVRSGRVITLVPGRSAARRPIRSITPSVPERQHGK